MGMMGSNPWLYTCWTNALPFIFHPTCSQVLTSLLIGLLYALTELMRAVSFCIAKAIMLQQGLSWMSMASLPILFFHKILPVSLSFPALTD